ncbi:tripartite tricarboxylate transporter substrate binding protein [Actinotalea sp. BY-33]|uniref:Tripartite tricarboxylate transporter substrate binding protein n=1 Tax=Actinotalea soli TaxID=2819234 RepID=A0A939LP86_9CELL|nr:tripartite tricarboxylate transporter substrate binding protein [Actinotalea soli]MBO1751113.1 tripartite tricarboxylate transporter substrate binding protein [Actinotalea soli]
MTRTRAHLSRRPHRALSAAGVGILMLGLAACSDADGSSADADGGSDVEAEADDFPTQQIEIIIPWAAGGGTDVMTRQLATLAEDTCGTRFIVSNRDGAAGATGHQAIADAEPDGYTLGTLTTEAAILDHLGTGDFTPEDFQGLAQLAANPALLAVSADSPWESFEDLQADLEAGETIRAATNGRGGTWDMAAAGLGLELDAPFTEYVPFNGAAEMIPAVLGGQVEALSPSAGEVLQQIEAGELRGLAVMAEERFPALPDVPTLNELDVDWTMGSWIGVAAPAGTPENRIEVLDACLGEAVASEEFQSFMEEAGFPTASRDAAEFEAFMDEEYARFDDVISAIYE